MLRVADFVDKERYKKNIARDKLTKGICSSQFLQQAQKKDLDVDVLLFEILMERMNLSTDDLEYILSEKDYKKIIARDEIEALVEIKECNKALKLLDEYSVNDVPDDPIAKMYYLRTKAQILVESGDESKLEEARKDITSAIRLTLNGIDKDNYKEYLISTYEVETILMYINILCLMGETNKGVELLEKSFSYLGKVWVDENLLARVIPKCAYLLSYYGEGIVSDERIAEYCEKGLYYLRKGSILYMLKPIMEKTINCYKRLGNKERVDYWEPYFKLLTDIDNEYGNKRSQTSLLFRWKTTGYYLDSEVVKGERLNKKYTQEELAEGIYSNPVSISNIENGKSSPNKTKYRLLFGKLGIDKARFSGFIIAESYDKIESIAIIRKALSGHKYDELIGLIDNEIIESELEGDLLEAYRTIALAEVNKDVISDYKLLLREKIGRVFPLTEEKCQRKPFQVEMDIIIAFLLRLSEKELENYVPIVEKILSLYESSKVNPLYNYRTFTSISILGLKLEYKNAKKSEEKERYIDLIKFCIDTGKGSAIVGTAWEEGRSHGIEDPLKKKLFYISYMISELFFNEGGAIRKAHYEKLFPPVVK